MTKNWTNEQLDAINKSNTNIIVSAGAGSGKTAVLTERIITKLKNDININELLVLTFTKAAASEMKERISTYLKLDDSLKSQLELLDTAYITTFDSYALSVVKKYGYLLNISPNVNICDSSLLKGKKEAIIDDIFSDFYESKDEVFQQLISTFCVKDDKSIKNYILKISDKLNMLHDKENYLNNYIEFSFKDSKIDSDITKFTNIIKTKINEIDELLSEIGNYTESDYFTSLKESLNSLIESNNYNDIKRNLDIKMPNLPRGSDDLAKQSKTKVSDIIKELNEICIYSDISDIKTGIMKTKNYVEAIISIIKELDKRINKFKYENDLYEFIDISNISIKLVKEHPIIREEIKNSFHEILIDEYQDTNDLQEAFISLIQNNNVYMVGDIKQSIYRFRNANPNIFKEKYDLYKNNNGGIKIDLNKNFRSRNEGIDSINLIFDDIMDNAFGSADYKKEHRLICGNASYIKTNNNDLDIYNYNYDKKANHLREEIEAFLIARDIKDKINNNYQVMEGNTLRNINYSDICILMDRGTNFELYKKIFTYMGIPLSVYKDESVVSSPDILVLKNILKLIHCIKNNDYGYDFRYSFMSVGRSFLSNYNDDELFDILINDKYKETSIYNIVYSLSKEVSNINIYTLLNRVIKEFNIYENLIKIGDINNMIARIDYLVENAKTLSNIGYNLESFIAYLDENLNNKSEVKIPAEIAKGNTCCIMNIHKSKGLEFKICYYSGLYAKFNISDLKEMFYYDKDYGIIVPYFNDGICNTIYKFLLKDKYMREEIEEKLRLFYVALTRCKEKMIIVGDFNNTNKIFERDNNDMVSLPSRLSYRSFEDILLSIKNKLESNIINIEIDNVIEDNYYIQKDSDFKNRIPLTQKKIVKKKINIQTAEVEESSFSKKINTLLDKDALAAIEIGKEIHYYLETLDFKNINLDDINSSYKNKVIAFLNQDILNDLDKAKIYKEYEFIYNDNNHEYHGIIDLLLEFDDHIKIIDYKLKDIDKLEYVSQLKGYKKFVESITKKKIKVYLYSIIDEKYREVL